MKQKIIQIFNDKLKNVRSELLKTRIEETGKPALLKIRDNEIIDLNINITTILTTLHNPNVRQIDMT